MLGPLSAACAALCSPNEYERKVVSQHKNTEMLYDLAFDDLNKDRTNERVAIMMYGRYLTLSLQQFAYSTCSFHIGDLKTRGRIAADVYCSVQRDRARAIVSDDWRFEGLGDVDSEFKCVPVYQRTLTQQPEAKDFGNLYVSLVVSVDDYVSFINALKNLKTEVEWLTPMDKMFHDLISEGYRFSNMEFVVPHRVERVSDKVKSIKLGQRLVVSTPTITLNEGTESTTRVALFTSSSVISSFTFVVTGSVSQLAELEAYCATHSLLRYYTVVGEDYDVFASGKFVEGEYVASNSHYSSNYKHDVGKSWALDSSAGYAKLTFSRAHFRYEGNTLPAFRLSYVNNLSVEHYHTWGFINDERLPSSTTGLWRFYKYGYLANVRRAFSSMTPNGYVLRFATEAPGSWNDLIYSLPAYYGKGKVDHWANGSAPHYKPEEQVYEYDGVMTASGVSGSRVEWLETGLRLQGIQQSWMKGFQPIPLENDKSTFASFESYGVNHVIIVSAARLTYGCYKPVRYNDIKVQIEQRRASLRNRIVTCDRTFVASEDNTSLVGEDVQPTIMMQNLLASVGSDFARALDESDVIAVSDEGSQEGGEVSLDDLRNFLKANGYEYVV